jgi:hypothetical protein
MGGQTLADFDAVGGGAFAEGPTAKLYRINSSHPSSDETTHSL